MRGLRNPASRLTEPGCFKVSYDKKPSVVIKQLVLLDFYYASQSNGPLEKMRQTRLCAHTVNSRIRGIRACGSGTGRASGFLLGILDLSCSAP